MLSVSNEIWAGHPRTAQFSVVVLSIVAILSEIFLPLILLVARRHCPAILSNNEKVHKVVYDLTPLLGVSIIMNTVQPTLSSISFPFCHFHIKACIGRHVRALASTAKPDTTWSWTTVTRRVTHLQHTLFTSRTA